MRERPTQARCFPQPTALTTAMDIMNHFNFGVESCELTGIWALGLGHPFRAADGWVTAVQCRALFGSNTQAVFNITPKNWITFMATWLQCCCQAQ